MDSEIDNELKKLDIGLDIDKVLNARLIELNSLSKEIKQKNNKLVLQRIPRFMRRRAASHNPRRVPSRFIKHPLSSIGNSLLKERRRKQRKKHVNKLKKKKSTLKRNKKKNRILLHVWFRKRFKLIDQLNYLIPLKNNTKNFRNLHKVSIKQCAFYYRPLFRVLEIRFDTEQLLNQALILLKIFFKADLEQCSHSELDLFFYKNNQCTIPVNLLRPTNLSIWVSIPIDFYSTIDKIFGKFLKDKNMKFTVYECQLERFRLIGPSAKKYLEILLNNSFHQTSSDQTNKSDYNQLDEQPNVSLDDLFTIESAINFKIISECKFLVSKQDHKLTIIIKDKGRSIVDVLVPKSKSKIFWYSLVKNKSHLVGGKIDYEYYALQNGFITYPSIGCLDLDYNKESTKFKILKFIINESNDLRLEDKLIGAERSVDFLKLCELPIENLQRISQLNCKQSFVNVKLRTLKKGSLKENDLIYMPTEQDLIQISSLMKMSKEERFANQIMEDSLRECRKLNELKLTDEMCSNEDMMKLVLQRSSRKAIGVIEIGNFSLTSGKSEAFGAICTNYFIQLIDLIKNSTDISTLKVLVRSSKSIKFRFCTVEVKNFAIF